MHTHLKVWEAPSWGPSTPSPGSSSSLQRIKRKPRFIPCIPRIPCLLCLSHPDIAQAHWILPRTASGPEGQSGQAPKVPPKNVTKARWSPEPPSEEPLSTASHHRNPSCGSRRFTPLGSCPQQSTKWRWDMNSFCGVWFLRFKEEKIFFWAG